MNTKVEWYQQTITKPYKSNVVASHEQCKLTNLRSLVSHVHQLNGPELKTLSLAQLTSKDWPIQIT